MVLSLSAAFVLATASNAWAQTCRASFKRLPGCQQVLSSQVFDNIGYRAQVGLDTRRAAALLATFSTVVGFADNSYNARCLIISETASSVFAGGKHWQFAEIGNYRNCGSIDIDGSGRRALFVPSPAAKLHACGESFELRCSR